MFKRTLAIASMLVLLVAAKAPPPVASVTVTTPVPIVGQAVDYAYVTGSIKPYEYPTFDIYCDFDGVIAYSATVYPTLFDGEVLFVPGDPRPTPATYPVPCVIEMIAFGGNRTHPGFGRTLATGSFSAWGQ